MNVISLYGKNHSETPPKSRIMSRGIILRDGKVLLSHEVSTGKWLTPGGRVEESESLCCACIREVGEETGLLVEPQSDEPFLTVNEYYEEWFFSTNYFLCDVVGACEQHFTDYEKEIGLEIKEVYLDKAVEIFSDYKSYKEIDEWRMGHHYREYKALTAVSVQLK